MIRLRKKLPGLCDKTPSAFRRITHQTVHREGVVSFRVDNRSGDDGEWDELYIIYNASGEEYVQELREGGAGWEVLADGRQADCRRPVTETIGSMVRVEIGSGMLLGRLPS